MYKLTAADKDPVTKGHELNNKHIKAAQLLIKQFFPESGSLQNTLAKIPLEHSENGYGPKYIYQLCSLATAMLSYS